MPSSVIGGKVMTMMRFVGLLESKRGLGFDTKSVYYLEAPEDNVLRFIGKNDKTGSCFVSINLSGVEMKKGVYKPFDPTWLKDLLDGAIPEDSFRLELGDEEASLSFSSSRGRGFRKPYNPPNELDVKSLFERLKFADEHFRFKGKMTQYEISVPSFRRNMSRCAKIHPEHFSLVSLDGRLYTYVKTSDEGVFFDTVSTNKVEGNYDGMMPITASYFKPILDRFQTIKLGIPQSEKVNILFLEAGQAISMHEFMDMSMMIGKNREYKPDFDKVVGEINAGIHNK